MPSIITCRASKLILQADSTNVRLGRVIHANRMLIDRKQLSIFNHKKQILIDFLLVWTGILQQCLFCNVWWWAYSVSLSMRRYFYILKLTNERLEWGHSLTPRPHFVWQWFGKSRIEQKWQKCAEECQDNSVQDNFRPRHVNTRLGTRLTNQRPGIRPLTNQRPDSQSAQDILICSNIQSHLSHGVICNRSECWPGRQLCVRCHTQAFIAKYKRFSQ